MGAGAQVGALADIGSSFEGDKSEVIDDHLSPDHGARFKSEFPREDDIHGGKNYDFRGLRDVGSEPS